MTNYVVWSASELEAMPTVESGHDADLKVDDPKLRVWLSRVTPGLVQIEQLIRFPGEDGPSWEVTDSYYDD